MRILNGLTLKISLLFNCGECLCLLKVLFCVKIRVLSFIL